MNRQIDTNRTLYERGDVYSLLLRLRSLQIERQTLQPKGDDRLILSELSDIVDFVQRYRMSFEIISKIFQYISDMFLSNNEEIRHAAFQIVNACIEAQSDRLGLLRSAFFGLIKSHHGDYSQRQKALSLLTLDGRRLDPFSSSLGKLLINWLQESDKLEDLITFIVKILRRNPKALDINSVTTITLILCDRFEIELKPIHNELEKCKRLVASLRLLDYFDVLLTYNHTAIACQKSSLKAMCCMVNIDNNTWLLMKHLLKSDFALEGLCGLLSLLEDRNDNSESVLRGAVFFVGMSCWGSQRIFHLEYGYGRILPFFLCALDCQKAVVIHEIILSLKRLVRTYGDLMKKEWNIIFKIFLKLYPWISLTDSTLPKHILETFSLIEDYFVQESYLGDEQDLFSLLLHYLVYLQQNTILKLVERLGANTHPYFHQNWLENTIQLVEKFFYTNQSSKVRQQALSTLQFVLWSCRYVCEDLVIEQVVLPYLSHIFLDHDIEIRSKGIDLIIEISRQLNTTRFNALLNILHQAVNHSPFHDAQIKAACGIVSLLSSTFDLEPSDRFLRMYDIIVKYVKEHSLVDIRKIALQALVCLSTANYRYQLEWRDHLVRTSRFLFCAKSSFLCGNIVPIQDALNAMIFLLEVEMDQELLLIAIEGISKMLINRFILTKINLMKMAVSIVNLIEKSQRINTKLFFEKYIKQGRSTKGTQEEVIGNYYQDSQENQINLNQITKKNTNNNKINRIMEKPEILTKPRAKGQKQLLLWSPSAFPLYLPSSPASCPTLYIPSACYQTPLSSSSPSISPSSSTLLKISPYRSCSYLRYKTYDLLLLLIGYINELSYCCTERIIRCFVLALTNYFHMETQEQNERYNNMQNKEKHDRKRYYSPSIIFPIQTKGNKTLQKEEKDPKKRYYFPSVLFQGVSLLFLAMPEEMNKYVDKILCSFLKHIKEGIYRNKSLRLCDLLELLQTIILTVTLSLENASCFLSCVLPCLSPEITCKRIRILAYEDMTWCLSKAIFRDRPYLCNIASKTLQEYHRVFNCSLAESALDFIAKISYGYKDAFPNQYPLPTSFSFSSLSIPVFNECLPVAFRTKTWLYGNSLVTISTGKFGYVQVVIRRVTGTCRWSFQLPNHLWNENLENLKDQEKVKEKENKKENKLDEKSNISMNELNTKKIQMENEIEAQDNEILRWNIGMKKVVGGEWINYLRALGASLVSTYCYDKSSYLTTFHSVSEPPKSIPCNISSFSSLNSSNSVNPSFLFSQMIDGSKCEEKPVLVQQGGALHRAQCVLDRTPGIETHKVGVLYVGENQTTEEEILCNNTGSVRYMEFLKGLGDVVKLQGYEGYTGGLDACNGGDGECGLAWSDDCLQAIFHVATFMEPNGKLENSLKSKASILQKITKKKRHIGNDFVHVIYLDSNGAYDCNTIPGQFNDVHIIVQPLTSKDYRIQVMTKPMIPPFGPLYGTQIISRNSCSAAVRLTAFNANIACRLDHEEMVEFVSNAQERLKQIKQIRRRLVTVESKE